jgi:hypothetical protein
MTTPCDRLTTLLSSAPEVGRRAAPTGRGDAPLAALGALEPRLAEHAADCPRCQAELARAQRILDGMGELYASYRPLAGDGGDIVERVMARAKTGASRSQAGVRRPIAGFVLAGLVGAGAAAGVVLALQPSAPRVDDPKVSAAKPDAHEAGTADPLVAPTPTPTPNVKAASGGLAVTACLDDRGETSCDIGTEVRTAIGETRAFKLSEGSTIQIDQDSHVRFDAERRGLEVLRGDAFLDVAHRDDLAPLAVKLPTGEVKVLGTELEVRAGASISVVDVVRGVVSVASDSGEARVAAGQAAWLRQGKKPVVRTSNGGSDPRHDWRSRTVAAGDGSDANGDEALANLGIGSLRARRPGAAADAERPLRLVDHFATVRIQGAYAKTTIEESFASEEAFELEGTYRFTLPPGAQVAELALLVDGHWEEGAFVERDRAEKIWAGVIRHATPVVKRREIIEYIWVPGPWRDPALLSWKQGNTFELRIFPIPARGERRVRIAYTESLPLVTGGRRYTLPLPAEGAHARPEAFTLDLKVGTELAPDDLRVRNYEVVRKEVEGGVTLSQMTRSFRPRGDLVVEIPDTQAMDDLETLGWRAGSTADGAKNEAFLALTLRPELAEARAKEAGPRDVVIIADTSYGMQKLRLQRAAEILRGIVAGLDGDRVQVLACATTCRSFGPFETASESLARDLAARLGTVEPLGSSRLVAAFGEAAKVLGDTQPERRRVIYLGDGVQTVGELDPARVVEAAREALGETRVTAVALGGETDTTMLAGLAKTHAGSFIDLASVGSIEATTRKILARQLLAPLTDIELSLPDGLVEVAPSSLGDLWPGEERVVAARYTGTNERVRGDVVLRGTLAGEAVERRWSIDTELATSAGNAFVPRLWAERRIADLGRNDDLGTKKEIVALSQAHHLLSRHTSLLVLESPAMAKAFDVHATRPVADWTGEEQAQGGSGELMDAVGGLAGDGGTADLDAAGTERLTNALGTKGEVAAAQTDVNDAWADRPRPAGKAAEPKVDTGVGRGGLDALDDFKRPAREPVMPRGRGEWVAMKKVWFKEATISERARGADAAAERELLRREARLDEEPASRERTMALVRWHLRMDDPDKAEALTKKWLEKDRMDPEALVALADAAVLRGDLARSRDLLASAVEADPRQGPAHLRMARLYEASGDAVLACEHLLSRALVQRGDARAQLDAIRCGARASRVLAGLDDAARVKVERELERDAKSPERALAKTRVSGPFRVIGTWETTSDLDLVAVSPQGRVLSWQGGGELTVGDVDALDREDLAFKGNDNGTWQIFVVRRGDLRDSDSRTEGALRISAHGQSRRVPFVIEGGEVAVPVAAIEVRANFRWERAE